MNTSRRAPTLLLTPAELNTVAAVGQNCLQFGSHSSNPLLKTLYDSGETNGAQTLKFQDVEEALKGLAGAFRTHSQAESYTTTQVLPFHWQEPPSFRLEWRPTRKIMNSEESGLTEYEVVRDLISYMTSQQ